ncbi:ATP-binding cassette domain-containing protein [Glycomyces sp. A-F 0318]|uniref:ABC transporter ATP-binding protein n=1 Tax=Glycomyces amatae TaxID=2881355 RepID=UPI001E56D30B|nr:ATP-binding cassette domain-containing protein [Glycomyces amatae]MCD0442532.1 ATP-binding cassette domain-containing protein [Glycomyces amatae]
MSTLTAPREDLLAAPDRPAALRLREVVKTYDGAHTVLDRVTLEAAHGTLTAVLGAAGSGKSTLLHCAAGLDDPTAGEAFVGGRRVSGLGEAKRTLLRQGRIGFVFQSYNLLPSLTVEENLQLPLRLAGAEADRPWLRLLAERTGVADLLRRRPGALTAVQQQRAAVARAFAARPDVVFADEPTGALGADESAEVLDLLRGLVDDWGPAVVVVTRDEAVASRADATWALRDGRLRPVLTVVK